MKFRTRFSDRPRVSFETSGPSLATQSHKDEVNINRIVGKYLKVGDPAILAQRSGAIFDDVSRDFDLGEALRIVDSATAQFSELSSKARKAFDNDPEKFFNYMQSDERDPQLLYDLGLSEVDPRQTPASPEALKGADTEKSSISSEPSPPE